MRGGLIVVGDGRANYLLQALEHLPAYPWAVKVLVDDTGNDRYHRWLAEQLPDWELVLHPLRLGGWGSVRSAFAAAAGHHLDWWFHLEEDFIVGDVDVAAMADTVMSTDRLAQMALMRQPVNHVELDAGNWLLQRGNWRQHTDPAWVEQPWFFCLNPMVARTEIARRYEWPRGGHEHHFTRLLADDGWQFGIWGDAHDQPRCLHIGTHRSEEWAW